MCKMGLVKIYRTMPQNVEIKRKEEKSCERIESFHKGNEYYAFVEESRAMVTLVRRREVPVVQ